jgi:hypothetical protein
MSVSMVLVLNDVVEDFQQQGQVTMSIFPGIQELGGRKELKQVDKFDGSHQTH